METEESFSWPKTWTPALPRIERQVKAVCASFGVRGADADDVFQETLVRVHRATFLPRPGEQQVRSFDSAAELAGWSRAVARTVLLRNREAAQRQRVSSGADPAVAAAKPTDPDLETLPTYLKLLTNPVERQVAELRFEAELTYEQIAERMGWRSVSRVHAVLHSALEKLRPEVGG